jgi:uncharacterized protein (TIGR02231 family)
MEVARAVVQVQLAAAAFTVARPEDVPADGTSRKVLLTTESLEAELEYHVVPRLDPRAYLIGRVENTAEFPLLAGTAGVFLSGAYLGEFTMNTVAPGESFDVAFGVDDRVTVKRLHQGISEGETGIVGRRAKARWAWEVRVRNGHRRAIDVVLLEQLPLSTRQDVEVTLLPGPTPPVREDDGRLRFRVALPPGQEGQVSWGYQVEYPADLSLGWME